MGKCAWILSVLVVLLTGWVRWNGEICMNIVSIADGWVRWNGEMCVDIVSLSSVADGLGQVEW